MNWLRLFGLLAATTLAGCGPQVSGPSGEPDPVEVIDEALEAEANPDG